MSDIYQRKIDIVVQSKYPEVLEQFMQGFTSTTKEFKRTRLFVITGGEYGAKEINKFVGQAIRDKVEVFGVFNDDLIFSNGWLESALEKLTVYDCVSPGCIETSSTDVFTRAVKSTEQDDGVVRYLYGPNALFNTYLFRKIGNFDERFDWTVDDLDWIIRLRLHGFKSVTLRKITMAHLAGFTRKKNVKAWNTLSKKNILLFQRKHGYETYRELAKEYKKTRGYFLSFK